MDGNNTLFTANLSDLTGKIKEIENEIDRLIDTDLTALFKDLQKVFIDQTRSDLTVELKRFEEKTVDLQAKINNLKLQTDRLVNTNFREQFNELQKVFIDQTRSDLAVELKRFEERSKHLQNKIDSLEKEISRLVNTDFTKLFRDLQKTFIDQTRIDLAVELKRFEKESTDLQIRNRELKKQIERLEEIDLEKNFDKLQRTLAEIFGAVNAINLTLTNLIQTLTGIVQSLGTIQTTIDVNHKEIQQRLSHFSETTAKHLTDQDKQAVEHTELLQRKMNALSEENESIKKELKSNKITQIVGVAVILIILIYLVVKQ